ncbi:MAG: DUF2336 domain-containing protein [Siculibacillus sp.]|nr:DUF2336 domain-containing protein [Siculibacillus sp.]
MFISSPYRWGMDIIWRNGEDPLSKIRLEIARSRDGERGHLLKPLAELHISTRGRPGYYDPARYTETVVELLRPATLFERMAYADLVADVGGLPPGVLAALLGDVYLVSRPLIERARLSDHELVTVMMRDNSESTLLVIAGRSGTGIPVTDRIVEHGTVKVLLVLAANDEAKLSMGTFARFSNMTAAQNDMDLALAKRSDLPIEIAKALHQRISERSRRRVEEMMIRDSHRGRRYLALGR